ncbi:hypothetical protein Nmel_009985 [Mimus melanotis]
MLFWHFQTTLFLQRVTTVLVSPSMCSLAHRVTHMQYCCDSNLKLDQCTNKPG